MTSVDLFDELCRVTTTLETLTTTRRDPAITIALKAIIKDLDTAIDRAVESGILNPETVTV